MTDDLDALYRACLDRPFDDTPRLVLADYLDDHDEAERAELIRAQCALARPVLAADRDRLTVRVWDLLTAAKEWLFPAWPAGGNFHKCDDGRFVCAAPYAEFTFRRGLVFLTTDAAAFVRHAAAVGGLLLDGVVLRDREPYVPGGGARHSWYTARGASGTHPPSDLPHGLFLVLREQVDRWHDPAAAVPAARHARAHDRVVYYPPGPAALSALGLAACTYARRRHLGALPPKEEDPCPTSPPSS